MIKASNVERLHLHICALTSCIAVGLWTLDKHSKQGHHAPNKLITVTGTGFAIHVTVFLHGGPLKPYHHDCGSQQINMHSSAVA